MEWPSLFAERDQIICGDPDDIEGYVRMCRSCHWKHDGTIKNITGEGMPPC